MAKRVNINPSNRGAFTSYCRRQGYNGVPNQCVPRNRRVNNSVTRRRAVLANNSRNNLNR